MIAACDEQHVAENEQEIPDVPLDTHSTAPDTWDDTADTTVADTTDQQMTNAFTDCGCHVEMILAGSGEEGELVSFYSEINGEEVEQVAPFSEDDPCGYFVLIDNMDAGWAHITEEYEYAGPEAGTWIPIESLHTGFDDGMYVDSREAWIYESPDTNSTKLRRIDYKDFGGGEDVFYDCCREWFLCTISFTDGDVTGWVPWYDFCPNDCTNCILDSSVGFPVYGE